MPQPLSQFGSLTNKGLKIRTSIDTARCRPELSNFALDAILSWSDADSGLLKTYLAILRVDTGSPYVPRSHDNGAIAYMAVDSRPQKMAMIKAVAEEMLEDNLNVILRHIISAAQAQQKRRDKLAHWVWGICDELPDAFLLINPRYLNSYKREISVDGNKHVEPDEIFVYRQADFVEIIEGNRQLIRCNDKLHEILTLKHPRYRFPRPDPDPYPELYRELCRMPAIQSKLPSHLLSLDPLDGLE